MDEERFMNLINQSRVVNKLEMCRNCASNATLLCFHLRDLVELGSACLDFPGSGTGRSLIETNFEESLCSGQPFNGTGV